MQNLKILYLNFILMIESKSILIIYMVMKVGLRKYFKISYRIHLSLHLKKEK